MSGLRGVFAGALALIALEAVVSTAAAANRTAGLFTDVSRLVAHLIDPNLPAIPDLRDSSTPQTSSATYVPPATTTTVPPAVRPPVVAPPPANSKPKPPKATVNI